MVNKGLTLLSFMITQTLKRNQMKQAVAAIVILGVVIFTLLAIFDLEISITRKKPNQQKITGHLTENKSAKTVERVGSAQDIAIPSPPSPAATVIAEPLKDAGVPSEQLTTSTKDPGPGPDDKLPPQPKATTIMIQATIQSTWPTGNKPIQGLGLLTDTGETEDNGILEPRSTQVQPTLPRKTLKKGEGTPAR